VSAAASDLGPLLAVSPRPLLVPSQEELQLQKLYPGFRTSWFKPPGDNRSYNAGWGETKKRWFIVEAYPLFVAIGGGCGICFLHCMRHFMFSPDVSPASKRNSIASRCKLYSLLSSSISKVHVTKTNRGNAMIENHREVMLAPDESGTQTAHLFGRGYSLWAKPA
jgi:hypothetical protein